MAIFPQVFFLPRGASFLFRRCQPSPVQGIVEDPANKGPLPVDKVGNSK